MFRLARGRPILAARDGWLTVNSVNDGLTRRKSGMDMEKKMA